MDDLVQRLRDYYTPEGGALHSICDDAADEIERLRAERDALRADAVRYRWLCTTGYVNDAAIAAAMAGTGTR